MALKAGRVGVRPDQVDPYGKIKNGGGAKITDFEDSEEIVFSSAATKIKAFLHQNMSNKIARALVLPVQTPTEKKIVGIDTSNAEILTGYSAADAGKVLAVSESGDLEWIEQQQGGGGIDGVFKKITVSSGASVFSVGSNNTCFVFNISGLHGKTGIIAARSYDALTTSDGYNILGYTDDEPAAGEPIGNVLKSYIGTAAIFNRTGLSDLLALPEANFLYFSSNRAYFNEPNSYAKLFIVD